VQGGRSTRTHVRSGLVASVLIIDDDPLICRFVSRGLQAVGFTTAVASDAAGGRAMALSGEFDLVLLDLVLGGGTDGFDVLRDLRAQKSTLPVLVMTGYPATRDVVDCLDGGADDYIVKPFRFEELVARVRVRLRDDRGAPVASRIVAGDLEMDLLTRRVTVAGRQVELTSREFHLLEYLMRHRDHVLSRAQLLSRVWGYSFDPTSNVVNVYVAGLRHKIGSERIETVRGAGYRLRALGGGSGLHSVQRA
jgi:DNA-binding response OmpR family regulator